MNDNYNLKEDLSTNSNNIFQKKQKRNLEIKLEDNNDLNHHEIQASKTLSNINLDDNSEVNENNSNKEDIAILEYKKRFNTLNQDEIENNNINNNNQKRRVEKKVNTNLKLLKIIKERMKEQKYKNMFEEEKIKNEKYNQEIKKENNLLNKNIEEEKKEENEEKKEEKESERQKDNESKSKNKDEEKKNILLNIINSKKYNKFQRAIKININNKNKKENDENKNLNNINDDIDKPVEVEQKQKIQNILKPKNSFNLDRRNIINKNKDNQDNQDNNSISTTKKGPMKIVELLKMRKKEENESKSKKKEIKNINEEENFENLKNKTITSYGFKPKMKIIEKLRDRNLENSLPKKSFRDEEDDNNNTYDFNNKTQNQFRNYKTINNNKIPINKPLNKKVKSYFNLNDNNINNNSISQNTMYNQNKTNSNINNYQNNIISKINYKNSFSLKNKFYEKLRNYYTIKNDNNNSINYNNKLEKNKKINKNFNTLDNSFDKNTKRKNLIPKRTLNKSTLNDKIYKPKKVSNNNSPERQNINQYERNTINYNNTVNDFGNNLYNKNYLNYSKIKKINKAYIKKSPSKYEGIKNSLNYRTIDGDKNINNEKTNKLISSLRNPNNNRIGASPEISRQSKILNYINLNNNTYRDKDEYFLPNNVNHNNLNNNVKRNMSQKNKNKNRNNNSIMFNIEDLIVLEDRLNDVILALESNDNIESKCLYFWNYYFNCFLYNLLGKIFKNKEDSDIIRLSINYKLISIMVCYEYSFEIDPTEEELYLLLLELMDLNHNNLIIICEYILTKIIPENKQNVWVLKLQQIIKNAKKSENKYFKNNISQSAIEKISFNINVIIKSLKNILLNFQTEYSDIILSLLKTIETKTYEEINDFFKQYILHVENFEGSIMASSYLKKNKYFKPLPAPYLVSPPTKPYTLILDLDETLVHFQIKTSKGGTLRARPYLFGFLEEMGHYYELVVWTSATEAYANSLIDAIEYEKKYFDYILYREHAIIMGDDFVKDLTRVGRGLDRIIIIDDMPQNFRLQKENGITIKPFFGDDLDDSALYELVPILKHIAEDEYDVRIGLSKYREEIVKRVTSNISKQNIY